MPITYVELEGKKFVKKTRKLSWLKISLGFILVFVVLVLTLAAYSYPKVKVLAADFSEVANTAQSLQKLIEKQDLPNSKKELGQLRSKLEKSEVDLKKLKILRSLPLLNRYYKDTQHALRAGVLGSQAGEMVIDSILPFGDILGLQGVKSNLKAEKKVEVLVTKIFPGLSKKANDLEKLLKEIKTETDKIEPDHYPANFKLKGYQVHEVLIQIKEVITSVEGQIPIAKEFLQVGSSILGYPRQKTYLLWFQNDKELRATGGFITSYAVAKIKSGKILDIKSDDIYQLDRKFSPFEPPPDPIRKYLNLRIYPIRDSNLSPDFLVSAQKFESFYKRIPTMPKIDGIIAIDTELVRSFLEFTGPITLRKYGETFSAKNDPKYKIPDVVYKLELYAERVFTNKQTRKGIIGDLMDEMLNKLLDTKPERFPDMLKVLQKASEEKHLLLYFHDQKAQDLGEELNYAGRIKDFDGDYLHVNNANFAGLKGNLYIRASINQDIVIAKDGSVNKKVKVTLRNIEKADGWLNSVYRNWMRVYVPKNSKLIDKKVFADFAENEDLGKKVWESFSVTNPLNFSESEFTYKLPFKVNKGKAYKLLIQKQPGTTDPHMIIRLNGKKVSEFDLKKDTQLEFKVNG